MIKKLEIRGVHMHIDAKLFTYASKKIGKLDRYISKHARKSAHVELILKEETLKTKKNYICEAVVHLPQDTITSKESTINMFAAIDIVEAKLKNQLKKYKELHGNPRLHRRLIAQLRRVKHQA
ncbi:MAG TPA: ribosome-associated translation inhibitor RaiA [Candidatus Saccharimonadales bacterium]|nr:ribosome-associated translation inhibitor RaiA [Candidatus Saccharimonadales bacterium]